MILNLILMAGNSGGQQPSSFGVFVPLLLIFAIMYFLVIMPQMKKQKQQKQLIESIKKGDKIVTVGGIFGVVVGLKEKENVIIVKIAENTKIELVKTSVARVIGSEQQ